jgi:uncharacterized iron-regulated membrane protein
MSRPILALAHRYLGLTLALFLTISGLTGAFISWDHELDEWLNPELFAATTPGVSQDSLALAEALERQRPELMVTFFPLVIEPGHNWVGSVVARAADSKLGYNQVALDPVTAEIKGQRQWGEISLTRPNLLPFLYKLHYSMHIPEAWGLELGVIFMGILAIVWCIDSFIALWISFPSWHQWRKSFRFRLNQGPQKCTFDLHRSGGMWIWPLLLILAVTSVSMNLSNEVMRPLVSVFSTLTPTPFETTKPSPTAQIPTMSRENILQLAQTQASQLAISRPLGAIFYSPPFGIYGVGFFAPGMGHGDGGLGNPWVYFDGATGTYLGAQIPGEGSAGDIFMQAQFPFHSGRILGFTGRVMVSVLGLLVAVVSITGVIIWSRKRKARLRKYYPARLIVG